MGDGKDSNGCCPFCADVDYPQNVRRSGTDREEGSALFSPVDVRPVCGRGD